MIGPILIFVLGTKILFVNCLHESGEVVVLREGFSDEDGIGIGRA